MMVLIVSFNFQLTREEIERRNLRRERNRLAAQKSRGKRKQRSDLLQKVYIDIYSPRPTSYMHEDVYI